MITLLLERREKNNIFSCKRLFYKFMNEELNIIPAQNITITSILHRTESTFSNYILQKLTFLMIQRIPINQVYNRIKEITSIYQ